MKQMSFKFFFFLASSILLFSLITTVFGATLTGEISYKRRAPKGAIVYFAGDKSQTEASKIFVDQARKQFDQQIYVGPQGSQITFKNSDVVNHNIYVNDKVAKVNFDVGLAPPGSAIKKDLTWDAGKVVAISCTIHSKMRAWIGSIPGKYYQIIQFAKKQKQVSINIPNVPDNLSKVIIWIANSDPLEIDLTKGKETKVVIKKRNKARGMVVLTLN